MRDDDPNTRVAVTEIGSSNAQAVIVVPGGPSRGTEYLDDLAGLGDPIG